MLKFENNHLKCLWFAESDDFQTTRTIKSLNNEILRLKEGLICIKKEIKFSGKDKLNLFNCKEYKDVSKFVFQTNLKGGRLKFNSLFPNIPYYLVPYYYYYYLKSFLKYD